MGEASWWPTAEWDTCAATKAPTRDAKMNEEVRPRRREATSPPENEGEGAPSPPRSGVHPPRRGTRKQAPQVCGGSVNMHTLNPRAAPHAKELRSWWNQVREAHTEERSFSAPAGTQAQVPARWPHSHSASASFGCGARPGPCGAPMSCRRVTVPPAAQPARSGGGPISKGVGRAPGP